MKIQLANELFEQLWMGDPAKCVYQVIYYEKDSVDTEIIKYFIMHGLGLCIRVNSYVTHMFYAWSFIHNILVIISTKKNK